MDKELVMYSRTVGCPFVTLAKRVLQRYQVPYREVFIDKDLAARNRVREWTGFMSVPTLVIANRGTDLPYTEPIPIDIGSSPRGIDRGAMITEPTIDELTRWLQSHALILSANVNH